MAVYDFISLPRKALIIFPTKLIINLLRTAYLAWRRKLSLPTYITISVVRTFLTTFTPLQIQAILPNTSKTCDLWIKKQHRLPSTPLSPRLQHHVYPLVASGGTLHWLSLLKHSKIDSKKEKILLFFHGGGYAVPLSPAHLDWCLEHIRTAQAFSPPINLSVAVLEYSLTPKYRYPTQLAQAAEALKTVFDHGFRARDVIVGGDSAGGNLTFALLGHLLHPHPDPKVPTVSISEPLAGAFGISPWVSMKLDTPSFDRNRSTDMLSLFLIRQSARNLLHDTTSPAELAKGEGRSLPGDAGEEWWNGLSNVVNNVYLNVGSEEMFYNQVVAFAETLRRKCGGTVEITVDIGRGESHDHILTQFMRGKRKERAVRALMEWIERSLA